MPFKSAFYLGLAALLPAALLPASCAREAAPAEGEAAMHLSRAEAAVASPGRTDEDRADDPMRKPAQVLAFMKVRPGMKVFEMEAGYGYYTQMLSFLAGPDGEVVMQSPPDFDPFLAEAIDARLADGRLSNVRLSKTKFDHLDADDASMDMATWMLGPHELYFTPSDGMTLGDVDKTYAEIFRILKPGGVFIVLDHAAAPGSPQTTGGTLHRIDPAIVKRLAAAAGFELIEESDILRHPDDMYDMSVFDPAVRRKTDRFLLKYKKPE